MKTIYEIEDTIYEISLTEEIKPRDKYIMVRDGYIPRFVFDADIEFNDGNNPNIVDKRPHVIPYKNCKVVKIHTNSMYYEVVEQAKEEKVAMYMKLTKKQLVEMLINCNDVLTKQVKNGKSYR